MLLINLYFSLYIRFNNKNKTIKIKLTLDIYIVNMRSSARISSSVQLVNRKLTSSSTNKNEKHNKSIHLSNNHK